MKNSIYFGSIAIEANRWKKENRPVIQFSKWMHQVEAAGFDGIELWQRHYTEANDEEKKELLSHPVPPAIFSSYPTFEDTDESRAIRSEIAKAVVETRARSIKFNLGMDASRQDEYIKEFRKWSETLPPGMQFLYECHPGDIGDRPDTAKSILRTINNPNIGIIVHPFCITPADLRAWFDNFSGSIRHLHVHQRDESKSFRLLKFAEAQNKEQCEILRRRNFRGSLTVEFTKGTALEKEDPEEIFKNACADLQFLRENLSWEKCARKIEL